MRDFSNPKDAADFLGAIDLEGAMEGALEELLQACVKRARGKLGSYQPASHGFPAWAPLADSTVRQKGSSQPEIDSGAYFADIRYALNDDLSGEFGTDQEYVMWQELGTSRMPPRAALGPAALEIIDEQGEDVVGGFVVGAITNRPRGGVG